MTIKTLDQNVVNSIYNKLLFTSNTKAEVLDNKTIVKVSNNLTSLQNSFNVILSSFSNFNKLTQYETNRETTINREKSIENRKGGTLSSGNSADLSILIKGFGLLAEKFQQINDKVSELDFSGQSQQPDIDIGKKKRVRGGRSRMGRLVKSGLALGAVGVGFDIYDRISEGQTVTQTAIGVGGGLAGSAAGGILGSKIGAGIGTLFGGVGAVPGAAIGGAVGSIGGYFVGGALADKGYETVTKPGISETSYSARFSDYLNKTISNVATTVAMTSPLGIVMGVGGEVGRRIYDYFTEDELPPNAGVLDAISKAEGTYGPNGYNTSLANGAYLPGGREQVLTDKSLEQILQLQRYMLNNPKNRFNSSALGRYQIVSTTLRDAAKNLNLDLRTTKFSPEVQDRMAMWILKKQGFRAWEGFKRKPDVLRVAQKALSEGRYKTPENDFSEMTGGRFTNPVPGGRLTSTWGDFRDGGSRRHKGIDLAAPKGTPVGSASAGTVVAVGVSGKRGGKRVRVQHGPNLFTNYEHLDSFNVKVGDRVSAGQIIGRVGSTGVGTGPHLHFSVWVNNSEVNPLPYLNSGSKPQQSPKVEQRIDPRFMQPFSKALSDPRRNRRTNTVVVERPVYVPVTMRSGGPRINPQSPRTSGNRSINYYIN